ncbi:MAG: hypothetical protein AAFX99_22470 [Myxococcota bacterium]
MVGSQPTEARQSLWRWPLPWRLDLWSIDGNNGMAKYRTHQQHDHHLKLTLTPEGIAREIVAGVILALPVCTAGLTLFFLPDYIGTYRALQGIDATLFWATTGVLLMLICLAYGARRATRVAFWELDGRQGVVRMQTRTPLGSQGELFESPLDHVESIQVRTSTAWIQIKGAPEQVLARAWWGRRELNTIVEQAQKVLQHNHTA